MFKLKTFGILLLLIYVTHSAKGYFGVETFSFHQLTTGVLLTVLDVLEILLPVVLILNLTTIIQWT